MLGNVSRSLLRSSAIQKQLMLQKRTMLEAPPRYRISFAEKVITGALTTIAVCAPICWVTYYTDAYLEESNKR